tara:strand:+ start:449 stop:712 length:264 start_codon:yes stop_codon:yes gene_type:complete
MNKWKRIDSDNSQAITLRNGRKLKVCKQYDFNMTTYEIKHRGEWQVHEWDHFTGEWEWVDTFSPMWFAKQQAIDFGNYSSRYMNEKD